MAMAEAIDTTVKSYSSISSEASGDLTSRNNRQHDENQAGGTSSQRRQSSADQNGSNSSKKPFLHQTLSMDDDAAKGTRANNGNGSWDTKHRSNIVTGSICLALGGAVLGLALPKNPHLHTRAWQILSSVVGYTYFLAWSSSFYPQVFLNHRRGTTHGLSVDFCVLNVLGYICYTIYTTSFYFNENVIKEYKERMGGSGDDVEITVQGNDVAFAVHAILMASVTLSQIGLYDTFAVRPPSRRIYFVLLATVMFCSFYLLTTWFFEGEIDFLGFLYVLGTIKVGVTIGKYVPQALLNRSRKSTVGWNVWNVILDLTGGVLSLLQLIGDCADMGDWTGITGNPAKIMLALVTICFDLIFLVQHYILYPDADGDPFAFSLASQ